MTRLTCYRLISISRLSIRINHYNYSMNTVRWNKKFENIIKKRKGLTRKSELYLINLKN